MKRYLPYILCFVLIASVGVGCFALGAHAQGTAQTAAGGSGGSWLSGIGTFFGFGIMDFFSQAFAIIVNIGLSVMGWLVTLSGGLLNISMNLTLNIKAFVDGTTAIYTTWTAIRDISSLFIIFFLLYAAIQMIIGIENPKWGSLIKNIVVAGVLVNFSFFFAGLGIDASNIVSMQLYNAIAPNNSINAANMKFQDPTVISSILNSGGMSDIFMQSLQITSVYKTALAPSTADKAGSTATAGNVISAPLKIILMGVTGIIIEFTAACSFTLAAAAFIFRFVLLLVLLAFSPIWFVSAIIPSSEIKKYAKKWTDMYTSMLLFMPVYLLLMYLALNVLTTSTFFKAGYAGNLITNSSAPWYSNFLILGVNAFIVIFLLNLPLVAAIEMGGVATSWIKKTGLTADNIWKHVGSQFGSRTAGRVAYSMANSNAMAKLASKSPLIGSLASAGLGKVSKADFGVKKGNYEERLKARAKSQEALHKQIGTLDRSKYATEAEYLEALKDRGDLQAEYRENLPWKGPVGGAIGFFVDNRVNRQSAFGLNDEANLKENLATEKDLKEQIEELNKSMRLTATDAEKAEKAKLESDLSEVAAAIKRANGKKNKKDAVSAAKILFDETKEEGGGEKPKETPPTPKP
jgi:hypothetical protein